MLRIFIIAIYIFCTFSFSTASYAKGKIEGTISYFKANLSIEPNLEKMLIKSLSKQFSQVEGYTLSTPTNYYLHFWTHLKLSKSNYTLSYKTVLSLYNAKGEELIRVSDTKYRKSMKSSLKKVLPKLKKTISKQQQKLIDNQITHCLVCNTDIFSVKVPNVKLDMTLITIAHQDIIEQATMQHNVSRTIDKYYALMTIEKLIEVNFTAERYQALEYLLENWEFEITDGISIDNQKTHLINAAINRKIPLRIIEKLAKGYQKNNFSAHGGHEEMPPLFEAIKLNQKNVVIQLLKYGADINQRANTKKHVITPLMYSVTYDNIDMTKLLLDKGADVNVISDTTGFAYNTAMMWGYLQQAKLVRPTIPADLDSKVAQNAITQTAFFADVEAFKYYLTNGISINSKSTTGTPVIIAALKGIKAFPYELESIAQRKERLGDEYLKSEKNLELWKKQLKRHEKRAITFQKSKLMLDDTKKLIEEDKRNINHIEILLGLVPDPNQILRIDPKKTAKVIELSLLNKANLEASDASGNTALLYALENAQFEFAKVIIRAGANIIAKNNKGKSALSLSIEGRNEPLLIEMLSSGSNISKVVTTSENYLFKMYEARLFSVVDFLLQNKGIDINAKDSKGRSLMNLALAAEDTDLIDQLIVRSVDLKSIDFKGKTLLHHAYPDASKDISDNGFELIGKLIKAGVDPTTKDYSGLTAGESYQQARQSFLADKRAAQMNAAVASSKGNTSGKSDSKELIGRWKNNSISKTWVFRQGHGEFIQENAMNGNPGTITIDFNWSLSPNGRTLNYTQKQISLRGSAGHDKEQRLNKSLNEPIRITSTYIEMGGYQYQKQ